MKIVTEVKRNSHLGKLTVWRIFEFIIALLLMYQALGFLLALVLLSPTKMFVDPNYWMNGTYVLIRGLKVWLCFFLIYLALILISGKKKTVLYLRRFRSELSTYMTKIIEDGLGRNFRIITLDDAKFKSLEVPNLEKWLSRIVPELLLIIVFPFIVSTIKMWGDPDSLQHEGYGPQLQYETTIMFAFFVVNLWVLLVMILALRYRIRRNSRFIIQNQKDLNNAYYFVAKLKFWFFRATISAPQATVMTVSDDLWRTAVIDLAEESDVALVDLSEPSEYLMWEVKHILNSEHPHVFIAEVARLDDWQRFNKASETIPSEVNSFSQILKDQEILVYDTKSDKSARSRFRKNLNQALENAAGSNIRPAHEHNFAPQIFKDCLKTAGFYAIFFLTALISGLLLQGVLRFLLWPELFH